MEFTVNIVDAWKVLKLSVEKVMENHAESHEIQIAVAKNSDMFDIVDSYR